MGELTGTALEFPAVLFGPPLLVVLAYWLFVLVGGVGVDAVEGSEGVDAGAASAGHGSLVTACGLRGVPVTIAVSLLTVIAWFCALVVTALTELTWLRLSALPFVLAFAWMATRLLLRPLRRLGAPETGVTHREFVGRTCTVRTGRVGPGFGQAEVAADDGATSLVQVRAEDPTDAAWLYAGSQALIFDYDAAGGFFRVTPLPPALHPELPETPDQPLR